MPSVSSEGQTPVELASKSTLPAAQALTCHLLVIAAEIPFPYSTSIFVILGAYRSISESSARIATSIEMADALHTTSKPVATKGLMPPEVSFRHAKRI
jgi:hypothetical protein